MILEYSADLFDAATADRLLGHYGTLLQSIVAEPDRPIATLPMLTEAERRILFGQWNAIGTDALASEFEGLADEDLDPTLMGLRDDEEGATGE